jgi:hypothetical protein
MRIKKSTDILHSSINCHINYFTALSVVGVLQYAFLPLAL